MFESLLEKVLSKFLGDFLDGFDSQNLHVGIWSGEVTISNVSIKPDVIKMLELPIKICFSHIGKLKLNVPWKSLTSSPVEVALSDLYIILSAEHPDFWVFQDYAGFKKKYELLEKFKEQIIKNITEKQKPKDDKEAGYVQKLVLRIIDNIQLSVSNIHIRFEDTIRNEFSWGISLKSIDVFTCDQNWNKKFFDRTKEENKKVPLQKLLQLSNIGAYWMQNENDFYHALSKEDTLKKMAQLIIQNQDPKEHPQYAQFILLLNAEGRLIQNTSGSFDQPEFYFTLQLQEIDLALENMQLQQIIRMAELFSLFQNKLTKQKKQKLLLSSDQIEQQKLIFLQLYEKILRSTEQNQKALTKDESDVFEQAVSNLDIDLLCDAAKSIIKQVQKEIAIKQAQEQKKKSAGWFSWGSKKKDDLIDEQEQEQLYEFIDQLADAQDIKDIKRPPDYVWLLVQISLQAGSLHIMKQFEQKREGLQLIYEQFQAQVQVRDASMTVNLGLQRISLDAISEPIENGLVNLQNKKIQSILSPISADKFLDFTFETNPQHHNGVDKYIKLRTNSLKFIFKPILLVRIEQFLDFQVKDETLKSAAWDQVEAAQDLASNQVAQSQLSPSILFLDVILAAPIVVLPIRDTNENWLVNLGELQVQTPRIDDQYYDHFEISLQDLTFKHFNDIEECHNMIANKQHLFKGFSVIENFKITINAQVLRGSSNAPEDKPQVAVQGVLPKLELFLNPVIYGRILKIGDSFQEPLKDPEEVQRKTNRLSIEKAQTERTTLMQNASKVGKIWKRGPAPLYKWTQYTAVLSGGYIYLFAKPKDQQPESFFWIRNSDFEDLTQESHGMNFAFLIKNKHGDNIVACDKGSLMNQWKDAIEQMRTQPRIEKKQKQKEQQEQQEQLKKQASKRPMIFGFGIDGFGLHIKTEDNLSLLDVGISGLFANAEMINGSIELNLRLRDLFVTDAIQEYKNPDLKYIVKSDPDPQSKELIHIKVQQLSDKDPKYNKVNLSVEVYFGTLQVFAKPLVIAKLLIFVTPEEPQNKIEVSKEKLERNQAKKAIEEQASQQATKVDTMQEIILMDILVKIRSIKATLVHRFTNLPIAEANIQNTEIRLQKYSDEMKLQGQLGNLQLIDLTNYPNTLSKEEEYTLIQPKEMIGVKQQEVSLLKINLRLFNEGSSKIQNNVAIIIDVEMSQLIINFMMQPVLRLLDYTLQQLLFALSNPKQTLDPNYVEQQKQQKEEFQRKDKKVSTIVLNQDEQNYLAKQLQNPPALSINVQIHNPQVILKPTQDSQSAMIIDLGNIEVSNTRTKSLSRVDRLDILPAGVWVDTFIVNMRDIQIYQQIQNQEKREFSLPFDFNVAVEIFGLCQQYQIHYPEITFDPQLKIYSYIAPMILQMTHQDYMFLMKCLFHNIAYDDGFDHMIRQNHPDHFKAFFEQQKENELKLVEMLAAEDEQPALSFQLDIENMTIFLLQDVQPKPTPFLRMMLVMMRVGFKKCNNGTAKVALLIRDMEGSVFNKLETDFLELPFIGSMNLKQDYSYDQVVNLTGLVRGRQATTSSAGTSIALASRGQLTIGENRKKVFKFEDTQNVDKQPTYKLQFNLDMMINGDKNIQLDLADFKLQLQTGPLFQVLALIAMDDPNLQPAPSKYVEYQQQQQQQQQQELQQQQIGGGSLIINVKLKNVITCMATMVENNVLAIRGVFDISLKMNPTRTVEEVRKEVQEKQIQEKDYDKLNENLRLNADLENLEICICKSHELTKKEDFRHVRKREILHPITLKAELIKALLITNDLRAFKDLTKITANISQTYLKVSFKDLHTLQAGLNYQLQQMPKGDPQPQQQQQQQQDGAKEDIQKLAQQQLMEIKIQADIESTRVIVLNDMGNSFTPLFDYQMDAIKAIMQKNNLFTTIIVNLPFNLQYFNPKATCWEPVIEKAGFTVDIYQSNVGLGGNLITIEQAAELERFNLNISSVFLQTVLKSIYIMQKMFQPSKQQEDEPKQSFAVSEGKQSFADDTLIQVSPYAVRNLSGYGIVVEVKDNQNLPKLQLGNNKKQNIQMTEEQEIKSTEKKGKSKKVNIIIKMGNGDFHIKDIDMDRNKTKAHVRDIFKVFTIVKLDGVTNQRILTIVSPIIFVNHTNKIIMITMNDKKNNQTVKLSNKGQDLNHASPIPFGYENTKIGLKIDGQDNYSDEINIDKLIKSEEKKIEIQTRDGQYLLLNIQKDLKQEGKVKITIEAPFRITNSLPTEIYIQMLNHHKETSFIKRLQTDETIEDYTHSHSKRTYLRVLVQGLYWSDEYKLYRGDEGQKQKSDCMGQMKLFDGNNYQLTLLVYEPWRLTEFTGATREFVIHCSGYAKNTTGRDIIYNTINEKNKNIYPIAGQQAINKGDTFDENIDFLSVDCGQLLSLSDSTLPDRKSQTPAPIATIGEPQFDMLIQDPNNQNQQLLMYMGAKIELGICNYKHTLFNKKITIAPRFVIVNQTDQNLVIKAQDGQYNQIILPHHRLPYVKLYEQKEKQPQNMIINMKVEQDSYQWSGGVDIMAIGIVYFRLKHQIDETKQLFFSCDTRQEGCTLFVIVSQIETAKAPYKITNTIPNVDVAIPNIGIILNSQNPSTFYAWDDPLQPKKIMQLEVKVNDPQLAAEFKPFKYTLSPDHIGLFKVYNFKPNKGSQAKPIIIALTITPDGFQKQILIEMATQEQITKFRTKPKQDFLRQIKEKNSMGEEEDVEQRTSSASLSSSSSNPEEDKLENQFNIKLKSFTLSIIHNADNKKRPAEYMVLTVKELEFVSITTDLFNAIQARIQYVNIDHNSQFFVNYPVILTPQKYGLYQKTEKSEGKYFMNVLIVRDSKVTDINLFQNIIFEMDPFAIKIEELFINSMLEFASSIFYMQNKIKENEVQSTQMNIQSSKLQAEEQKEEEPLQQSLWQVQELPPPSLPTYIAQITISPIQIQLTFQLQSRTSDLKTDDMALFKSIAQALGVVLSNIDESPLSFSGLQLDNCFDTVEGIVSKLVNFYKNEGLRQIFKLLGSLSVIGNPIGLFNNVSTGMKDFLTKPAQGLTQGPLEAGLGLAQGAGSLVSHTIAGAFNSVNKITGSLGSGLTSLSMDEDYIKQREKMKMQKPKHLGDGLGQAGKSLYQGIFQGITGVFVKPFKGAKEGGVVGAAKGTLQGLTGLIVKPVAGVFDAVSQTAEGVKNTVSYFDDKPNENRARNIRPMYGYEGYYTEYVDLDAEGYAMIHFLKSGSLINNRFWAAFLFSGGEKDNQFMFTLTLENLILMSFKKKKKVWIISVNDVAHVDQMPQGIKIYLKKPQKSKELKDKREAQIMITEGEMKMIILSSLNELLETYNYINQ